jgi:DNA-binding transcriptional ArsR family regulator
MDMLTPYFFGVVLTVIFFGPLRIRTFAKREKMEARLPQQEAITIPFLNNHLDSIAILARSLADGNRLRILLCVTDGKKSVSQIVEELKLSQPLVSHHLKELKRTLLVNVERRGPFIYYEIADKKITDILKSLNELVADLLSKRKSF